jgi:hypothetical protein
VLQTLPGEHSIPKPCALLDGRKDDVVVPTHRLAWPAKESRGPRSCARKQRVLMIMFGILVMVFLLALVLI